MDELIHSEKVLKARVIEKCNDNYLEIKQDYKKFSEILRYTTNPSIADLVENSENFNHYDFLSHLSSSFATLDESFQDLPFTNENKESTEEYSLLLNLIRNSKYKFSESTLYTCNIDSDSTLKLDFKDYTDGYYKLQSHFVDSSTKDVFDLKENFTPVVDKYWKSVKSNPKEDLSILKDFQSDIQLDPSQDSDEDFSVKNLFLAKLIGTELSYLSKHDYFDDYYNFNNKRKLSLNFDIQKQLRQVYIKPKHVECREFGLIARGLNNDLILEKCPADVVEYMVVFGEGEMDVYACETMQAHVTSQKHIQKSCVSKFVASEIVRLNLRNKLILKLKRHQNAKAFNAKDVKNSNMINKFITSATLGCLWNDWNYYGGIIVPEVSIQQIIKEPGEFLATVDGELASAINEFLEHLSTCVSDMDTFESICAIVRDILLSYRNLIMGKFHEDYRAIKNKSFLDLKTRPAAADITITSPTRVDSSQQSDSQSQPPDPDLHEQRLQLLPSHNKNATSPEELTSLSQLVSLFGTDFEADPFVSLLSLSGIKNVSKTVLNASKTIKSMGKNKNESLDNLQLVLSSLKILDLLVFLLQKCSKSFNGPKELQAFIASSKYKIDFTFCNILFHLFYEKSHDTHSIKVIGSKRLMCYTIWFCLYLSPKYSFDFSPLINIDLKNVSNSLLFNSCVDLTSIAPAGRSNKTLYRLVTPLLSSSKKINITSLISNKNKRFRAR